MRLFDTHCHLDDEQFDGLRGAVVDRARSAGVERILAVATTLSSSRACLALAEEFETVLASVGIQPNYVASAAEGEWEQIVALADNPRVVALGETGLDRFWDHTPFPRQQEYFQRHLQLSAETGLPFIVHMRDCEQEVLEMLRQAARRGPLRGVMHSFTGSRQMAQECVAMGMYISFAGMVTYKKSDALRAVAAEVPEERLLVETDAPYLSPHPHRGQRPNEPAMVQHTAACLADTRGVSPEVLAARMTENACRLFGVTL